MDAIPEVDHDGKQTGGVVPPGDNGPGNDASDPATAPNARRNYAEDGPTVAAEAAADRFLNEAKIRPPETPAPFEDRKLSVHSREQWAMLQQKMPAAAHLESRFDPEARYVPIEIVRRVRQTVYLDQISREIVSTDCVTQKPTVIYLVKVRMVLRGQNGHEQHFDGSAIGSFSLEEAGNDTGKAHAFALHNAINAAERDAMVGFGPLFEPHRATIDDHMLRARFGQQDKRKGRNQTAPAPGVLSAPLPKSASGHHDIWTVTGLTGVPRGVPNAQCFQTELCILVREGAKPSDIERISENNRAMLAQLASDPSYASFSQAIETAIKRQLNVMARVGGPKSDTTGKADASEAVSADATQVTEKETEAQIALRLLQDKRERDRDRKRNERKLKRQGQTTDKSATSGTLSLDLGVSEPAIGNQSPTDTKAAPVQAAGTSPRDKETSDLAGRFGILIEWNTEGFVANSEAFGQTAALAIAKATEAELSEIDGLVERHVPFIPPALAKFLRAKIKGRAR